HGPRFIDATNLYTKKNQEIVRNVAQQYQLDIKEGIYTWMTGPSYETPAEIHMIRLLGGDAVGMSTVPEVLVANHGGMNVTGISCITNLAAGMQDALNHEEVVETSNEVKPKFIQLLQGLIEQL
ncbi:purine-nucleoside phosphorylase, partial [Aerococcaceae bacterium DSM 111020]|nr:purine-nucleoside phosphorylase [Aerococcaceae bacterium DSM 111020]